MKTKIGLFLGLEAFVVLMMILNVVPQSCAYLVLLILLLAILKLSDLDFLKLYIVSIPFFVVLPPSFASDAMSVWRIVLLFWFLKIFLVRFKIGEIFFKRGESWSQKKQTVVSELSNYIHNLKKSNYYHILILALALCAISLFSLLFAQSVGVGIKEIIFVASIFLLFPILLFSVKNRADLNEVIKHLFFSSLTIIFFGYFQFILTFFITLSDFWGFWYTYFIKAFYGEKMMILLSYSNTWFSYYEGTNLPPTLRMFSVMPDSHSFAMLMILFSPIVIFYYASQKEKGKRLLFVFVFALFLLAIFFSGSRGAWAGWVIALVSSAFLYRFRKRIASLRLIQIDHTTVHKKHYKTVIASLVLFLALFPVSSVALQKSQEVQMIMEGMSLDDDRKSALLRRTWSTYDFSETSNKKRMQIWKESVSSVASHPLTGVGLGNFPVALGESVETSKMGSSAHNIYLDIAVEVGLFGLLVFLLLILEIMRKLFQMSHRLKKYSLRLFAASFLIYFIWIMAYGLVDVVLLNDKVLMFMVIMLAIFYKIDALEDGRNEGV
jgi:hypothetical protein